VLYALIEKHCTPNTTYFYYYRKLKFNSTDNMSKIHATIFVLVHTPACYYFTNYLKGVGNDYTCTALASRATIVLGSVCPSVWLSAHLYVRPVCYCVHDNSITTWRILTTVYQSTCIDTVFEAYFR
jgi:hypothetical protein